MGKSYNGFSDHERTVAYYWFLAECRAGRRTKKPTCCDGCGQTEGWIEPHDKDYGAPYGPHIGSFSMCCRCHMLIHCRFKSSEVWNAYRAKVREGFRAKPLPGRNWYAITNQLRGVQVEYTQHTPLPHLVLEEIASGVYLDRGGPDSSERRAARGGPLVGPVLLPVPTTRSTFAAPRLRQGLLPWAGQLDGDVE